MLDPHQIWTSGDQWPYPNARVSLAHAPVKLLRVSKTLKEIEEELQRKEAAGKEGEVCLLIPQGQILLLSTSGPGTRDRVDGPLICQISPRATQNTKN